MDKNTKFWKQVHQEANKTRKPRPPAAMIRAYIDGFLDPNTLPPEAPTPTNGHTPPVAVGKE